MHQTLIISIIEFIALIAYVVLCVFALLGAVMYAAAYFKMKRTKIIGALALMLFAIAADTIWWLITEWIRFTNPEHEYITFSIHPLALLITKIILAAGVINFAYRSVKRTVKESHDELGKCFGETNRRLKNGIRRN